MLLPPQSKPIERLPSKTPVKATQGIEPQQFCVSPWVCTSPDKICMPCSNGQQLCQVGRFCYVCSC